MTRSVTGDALLLARRVDFLPPEVSSQGKNGGLEVLRFISLRLVGFSDGFTSSTCCLARFPVDLVYRGGRVRPTRTNQPRRFGDDSRPPSREIEPSILARDAQRGLRNRTSREAEMKRILRYGLIALAVGAPSLSLCSRDVPLVAGTLVQCTLDEPNFSSRTAKIGDPLICYARPLSEFGCTALPKGTELAGRFIDYKDPGRLLGKRWTELEFDRLILPDGEASASMRVISVHGYKVDTDGRILGRGHVWRDAVGWALPVLWPVKLAMLPMRGPRPTLKGERAITLRLLEDVRIPCRGFGTDVFRSSFHYFGTPGENLRPLLHLRVRRTSLQALR